MRPATRRARSSRRSSPRTVTRSGSRLTAIAGVRSAAFPTRHISGMPMTTSVSPWARCRKAAKQPMRTSAQVVEVSSPDGAQPGEGLRRDDDRRGDRALRRPGRRARGTRRVGQRGEAVAPVGPVLLVALAHPVLLVGRDEVGDRAELGRRPLGAPHQRRVVRGRPPGHHRRGVPVDDHVVVELHPPHRAVGEPQQCLAVQPAVHQPAARLGRPRPDGRHGRMGRRDGVGLGAEVDDLGGLRGVVGQRLARTVRGVVEAQVQRLGLVDRGADRLREGGDVERLRPVDLHDVADEVVRGVRLQPLRVPESRAGRRSAPAARPQGSASGQQYSTRPPLSPEPEPLPKSVRHA